MEKVASIPYKDYVILIYNNSAQFFFKIAKNGQVDDVFYFDVKVRGVPAVPFDEVLFDEQIQICKDHIDIITKTYLVNH